MRVYHFTRTSLAPITIPSVVLSFAPAPRLVPHRTTLFSKEVATELDTMCIANAADLISQEEKEELIHRFDEQTEKMAFQIAKMQSVVRLLKSEDDSHLEEGDITNLKDQIIATASGHIDESIAHLDDAQIRALKGKIASTIKKEKEACPHDSFMFNPVPFMHMP